MTFLKTFLGILYLVLLSPTAMSQLAWNTPSLMVDSGDVVAINFTPTGYQNLIASQGTIQFDETILEFSHVDSFGLASISSGSFGQSEIATGRLSFSWYEADLVGRSIPDGNPAFTMFFTVIGNPGEVSQIELIDQPVTAEFVDDSFVPVPFTYDQGNVTINGGIQPSSIEENYLSGKMTIYPNPFSDWIEIETKIIGESIDVIWFNLAGEMLKHDRLLITQNTIKLNTEELNQGIYLIRVGNETVGFENQLMQKQ